MSDVAIPVSFKFNLELELGGDWPKRMEVVGSSPLK